MKYKRKEKMNKVEIFQKELEYIHDPKIKEFATKAVQLLPDYFFHIGASSTGKYHPAYALGEGGLVRHVRAAIRIAVEMFRMSMIKFTEEQKDLIIVALLLHDGAKSGLTQQKFTVFEHPLVIAKFVSEHPDLQGILSESQMNMMLGGIKAHMSQWNTSPHSDVVLPLPESSFEKMICVFDYLASRKCLIMDFDVEVNRE